MHSLAVSTPHCQGVGWLLGAFTVQTDLLTANGGYSSGSVLASIWAFFWNCMKLDLCNLCFYFLLLSCLFLQVQFPMFASRFDYFNCAQIQSLGVVQDMERQIMAPACIRPNSQRTNQPRLEGTHALTRSWILIAWLEFVGGHQETCLHDGSLLKPWVTGCVDWTTARQLGRRFVCSDCSACVLVVMWASESDEFTVYQIININEGVFIPSSAPRAETHMDAGCLVLLLLRSVHAGTVCGLTPSSFTVPGCWFCVFGLINSFFFTAIEMKTPPFPTFVCSHWTKRWRHNAAPRCDFK